MKTGYILNTLLAAAIVLCFSNLANAVVVPTGGIVYTGTSSLESGTGFGTLTNLVDVHNTGTESGSVIWTGTDKGLTGDATNTSDVWSFAQLEALGFSSTNLPALSLNINQSGSSLDITLLTFQFLIFDSAGTLVDATIATAINNTANTLTPNNDYPAGAGGNQQGQGSAAYLFTLDADAQTLLKKYFDMTFPPDYYLGAATSLGTAGTMYASNDGADGWYLVNQNAPVPEPGTLVLLGMGMVGLAFYGKRRISKN